MQRLWYRQRFLWSPLWLIVQSTFFAKYGWHHIRVSSLHSSAPFSKQLVLDQHAGHLSAYLTGGILLLRPDNLQRRHRSIVSGFAAIVFHAMLCCRDCLLWRWRCESDPSVLWRTVPAPERWSGMRNTPYAVPLESAVLVCRVHCLSYLQPQFTD